MTDQLRPNQGSVPSSPELGASAELTIDQAGARDSGPLLPAGGSVLQALFAHMDHVPRVHLREPDVQTLPPIDHDPSVPLPFSQELPSRYQLVGEIARGGMGAVFKGRDVDLGRDVAVKIMLDEHQGRTELLRRFVEEAQIGGQLQHPGIVPIYELGQAGDTRPFFTMKLVKGKTLAVLLKERHAAKAKPGPGALANAAGSVPTDPRLLDIFEQVCQTVAYAHARGVIHRDLKPSNIMVGSFGEVQVMDWGLAKVLPRSGSADAQSLEQEAGEEPTDLRAHRRAGSATDGSALQGQAVSHTCAGAVLGTLAYMAPEQARGEIATLDERCDVFGLGALLCHLLTGSPPFRKGTSSEQLAQSSNGDLADAFARLERSGAAVELVQLARGCLAPQKEDRPQHAGAVAARVTAYLQSVQARLQQAEVEQAAAHVRAQEERRRRRVTVALAAALLLLVGGSAAVGLWYQHEQARQAQEQARLEADERHRQTVQAARQKYLRREVADALAEAKRLHEQLYEKLSKPLRAHELLSDIDQWRDLVRAGQAALARAQALARSEPALLGEDLTARLQKMTTQLQATDRDYQLARQLDGIRLEASTLVGGKWEPAKAVAKYARVFTSAGYDVHRGELQQLAARLQQSAIRPALVAALDHWAAETADKSLLRKRLLALAQKADPEPWRDQVREALLANNIQKLKQLAEQVDVTRQSPQIMLALASELPRIDGQGAALLRRAVDQYPRDFWLHFVLGNIVQDRGEKVGCYRTALALRTRSSTVHHNLGSALQGARDTSGAIRHYRLALELEPNLSLTHINWGVILADQHDLAGAIRHYREALRIDPKDAQAHFNFGNALYFQKDYAGAARHYELACQFDSRSAQAQANWGSALLRQKDHAGAVRHFQLALQINPNLAQVHNSWGNVLQAQKDHEGAVTHFQLALELDPKDDTTRQRLAVAHHAWGNSFRAARDYQGAITHYQLAVQFDPKFTPAHVDWGNILYNQRDYAGAIRHYQLALQIKPNLAEAHHNWGNALKEQKDYEGAIAHYQLALRLDPKLALTHNDWGNTLRAQQDHQGAIVHYQLALEIDPKLAIVHHNWANVLKAQKDYDGAIAHYRSALELNPKLAASHANWGLVLAAQKDYAGAVRHYQLALQLDPRFVKASSNCALAHLYWGNSFQVRQDYTGAINHYQLALHFDPKLASAHNNWGLALAAQENYSGAITHYQRAIQLDPRLAAAYYNLGTALYTQKDYTGAIGHFQQVVKLNPQYAQAHTNWGLALVALEDYAGAVAHLQRALQLDPKAAKPYVAVGRAFLGQGEFTKAVDVNQKALRLLPADHPLRGLAQKQLQECQQALQQEQRAVALVQGKAQASGPAEPLRLAQFCRKYRRYSSAVRLYSVALADQPQFVGDLTQEHAYQAACAATLAAAGQGFEAAPTTEKEQADFRQQALRWLRTDLTLRKTQIEKGLSSILALTDIQLPRWQIDPALAKVREAKELATLPREEQQTWQQLWEEVQQILSQVCARRTETEFQGILTAEQKERVHEIKMRAGWTYVLDQRSKALDAFLRLEDASGKKLAEDDDSGGGEDARIIFTAPHDGTYRVVATSLQQRGTGAYTLTIREYGGKQQ
jgi:tetratricopeptide (TPR) repeat protein/tRNA A-37 threonylcarbamoyl transferase component Bud32